MRAVIARHIKGGLKRMKVGDKVVWESQAQGSWMEKRGIVVADVPAGVSAKQYIPASAKKSHSRVDKDKSSIDRVLVAIPAGEDGQITHYYCPRKSVVKLESESEN